MQRLRNVGSFELRALVKLWVRVFTLWCCFMQSVSRMATTLGCLPRVLIVDLKRFNSALQKIDTEVEFEERLCLTSLDGQLHEYLLVAAVEHIGRSISSGHYQALVRRDEAWWRISDARVDSCDTSERAIGVAVPLLGGSTTATSRSRT